MAKRKPHLPDDSEESQVRMGFGEHLEELRRRLIYSLLGSVGFIAVCLYYMYDIVGFLLRPYRLALIAHGYPPYLGYAKPAEPVITFLGIGVKAGLIVASPWIIYQLWLFVGAGLYKRERKLVYKYIGPSAILFLLGVAFFYFLVLPLTLNFFIGFNDATAKTQPHATWIEKKLGLDPAPGIDFNKLPTGDAATMPAIPIVSADPTTMPAIGTGHLYFNAVDGQLKFTGAGHTWVMLVGKEGAFFVNLPQFDEYLDFVTFTALVFGVAFELPMVILILAQIGIVMPSTFRKFRKYAYFIIALVSCVAAPSTDVLTMMCLMVPLIGLYEAGVLAASIAVGKEADVEEPE
ncbi:MAG TPA: twin-arginine translocase subunit TatC [Phycisphaerae bacterium]|nr:twin-arginine translocase subunit TatC [Phycisphaerae bacterium]